MMSMALNGIGSLVWQVADSAIKFASGRNVLANSITLDEERTAFEEIRFLLSGKIYSIPRILFLGSICKIFLIKQKDIFAPATCQMPEKIKIPFLLKYSFPNAQKLDYKISTEKSINTPSFCK